MDIKRIEKIRQSIPKKMFFDKIFEKNGCESSILADIIVSKKVNIELNNFLNCAALLNKEQEYHLFRKYNYLKYRLLKLTVGFEKTKEKPSPKPSKPVKLERLGDKSLIKIEKTIEKINNVRNLLLTSNMRLIVKQVTRYAPNDSFKRDEFFSNAYMHVLKSIECFDYRRGFKFSTYCVNVLKSNLSRDNNTEFKKQALIEHSEHLDKAVCKKEHLSNINHRYNKEFVKKIFEEIRKTKRAEDKIEILKGYFEIDSKERLMLKDLAKKLGISKERVRQIKMQTLDSLKHLCYDPIV